MFILIYLSIFFVVVFKILVISVSNMDDNLPSLFIDVYIQKMELLGGPAMSTFFMGKKSCHCLKRFIQVKLM